MKYVLFFCFLFLGSCSNIAKETLQGVDDYADTMQESISDAHEVQNLSDEYNATLQENLQNISQ